MALFRKFFYRKPPDGLLEISERVYVFDYCFTTDVLEDNEYKVYIGGIVSQLRDHLPDASFMVFNFREGDNQSQISNILSDYDMTVMDYPRQYEGCPLLTMEMIHHFLRSGESWLLLGQQNVLLMHCERGGWPVLAFMLAALLIYRKQYAGEQKTLDMIYKQAPKELLQLMSALNPLPSQLRYLQYVSRRNVASEWPPLDRALTLDCIIIRFIPRMDSEGGCRPIFRIYGQDTLAGSDRTSKVLFSTPKRSKFVRYYKQEDCELIKIDIHCHIQGDVVLEAISLEEDLEREIMMFRVMFNTAFIRSNILMLNRDEIDMLWTIKDQFPKDFRAEVLFSEMDAATSRFSIELPNIEDKEGLPIEAFAKVKEIFSSVDWLDPKKDMALNVLQQITATGFLHEMKDASSPVHPEMGKVSPQSTFEEVKAKAKTLGKTIKPTPSFENQPKQSEGNIKIPSSEIETEQSIYSKENIKIPSFQNKTKQTASPEDSIRTSLLEKQTEQSVSSADEIRTSSSEKQRKQPIYSSGQSLATNSVRRKIEPLELQVSVQRSTQSKIISQRIPHTSRSAPVSLQGSPVPISRYHSAPSSLGITALLHDHATSNSEPVISQLSTSTSMPLLDVRKQVWPVRQPIPPLSPQAPSSTTEVTSADPSQTPSFKPTTFSPSVPPPSTDSLVSIPPSPPPPPPPPPPTSSSGESTSSSVKKSSSSPPPPSSSFKDSLLPPPPPLPPLSSKIALSTSIPLPPPPPKVPSSTSTSTSSQPPPPPPTSGLSADSSAPPPPPPPYSGRSAASSAPPPPPPPNSGICTVSSAPPPPPPTPGRPAVSAPPPPPTPGRPAVSAPPPPPPPSIPIKESSSKNQSHAPPIPPPPAPSVKGLVKSSGASPNGNVPAIPGPPSSAPFNLKGQPPSRPNTKNQALSRKSNLKPYHWLKLTRAMQGSLWAEAQKADEASKAPEFDMSEIESLFSIAAPNSDNGNSSEKSNRRALGPKIEKVQLIELRRAYNCEIMLTKVKIPLPDLMSSVLALDDSALDVDQIENLIKFCPTKEEMEQLKAYTGDKENLGKCEQFFFELMKVPRVEAKLRVFSFKIQFRSQVSDLRNSLNIVNSASEEIRSSAKLKRIMQTILSLGNALNHGTARGSAIGFRLDSLLKLTDTRARNNKMTLMHYLCKVLAEKLPELLDFHKDLVSLEASTKIQLKYLAEEMQAISKGLEKVVQELTTSQNDGPVSEYFCETLKEFLSHAEADVRCLASLYSGVGRNADALALYFGEDPARCPFEQVVSTLLNFVRMFVRAHEENCKKIELENKKAQKEAENEKLKISSPRKVNSPRKDSERLMQSPTKSSNFK